MKIRTGFVSNSSSSSFVCAVCGGIEAVGRDDDIDDVGMTSCKVCGHCFHTHCIKGQISNDSKNNVVECPICNFKTSLSMM